MSKITDHIQNILSNLPKTPGVYQMRDKEGRVIYVGKAKNLSNRVSSYFRDNFIKEGDISEGGEELAISESKTPLNPLLNRVQDKLLTGGLSLAKRQMVAKITDIEIITCQTEVEALVLETNLIKHLTPKYNILMKDDKNLAYLKITNSLVPELIKTRQRIRDGGIYFGPYVSAVEQSVRALRRIFRIRNCRVKFAVSKASGIKEMPRFEAEEMIHDSVEQNPSPLRGTPVTKGVIQITDKAGKTIPCMDYYIGLCPAPCLLENDKIEKHNSNIDQVKRFLSGESGSVFANLESEMRERANHQEFEKAQEIKQTILALRGLHERQSVRDMVDGDIDICIQYEKYDKIYIAITQVRSGQIVGIFRHEIQSSIDEGEDIMISFLMRQYLNNEELKIKNEEGEMRNEQFETNLPQILLCQNNFHDSAFIDFLEKIRIQIEIPKIGPKKELLDFTRNQLREYAYKRELATLENKILTRDHMVHILERLGYPIPPKGEIVFECYDISHTDGHFTYASRVVIVNGKPDPKRYKKYKIKTLEDGMIDDFASHREVMMRRTIEGITENNFPHLIIIDGGKGQLSSAMAGIKEGIYISNKNSIDSSSRTEQSRAEGSVAIQVSENSEYGSFVPQDDKSISSDDIHICSIAKREEEIFIPGSKDPIMFEKGTPELMVLQKARDESHRFSITANRSARTKAMKKNILEELPGIGPVTRKKLLKIAGSVNGIKDISTEELTKICTVTQIETLRDHGIFFS